MDTSETYIKMCDCPEIRSAWTPKDWDTCYCKSEEQSHEDEQVVVLSGYETDSGCYGHETPYWVRGLFNSVCGNTEKEWYDYHIWLPRQDQLQAMATLPIARLVHVFQEFIRDSAIAGIFSQYKSMEQLWLAFVMKEKHDKTWNGEEWKNE